MGLDDYINASTTLAKVVEFEPAHAAGDAAFALAVSLEKSGRKESARKVLEQIARTTSLLINEAEYVPSYHRREVRPWVRRAKKALSSLPTV